MRHPRRRRRKGRRRREGEEEERKGGGRNMKPLPAVAPGGSANGNVPKNDNYSQTEPFSGLLVTLVTFSRQPLYLLRWGGGPV